jgi:hypothetical protein
MRLAGVNDTHGAPWNAMTGTAIAIFPRKVRAEAQLVGIVIVEWNDARPTGAVAVPFEQEAWKDPRFDHRG